MPRFQWKMEIEPQEYDSPGDYVSVEIVTLGYDKPGIALEVRDDIPGECASVVINASEAHELIAVLRRAVIALEGE